MVPLWTCDDSGVEGLADGTASLSVYLTDAAGDVAEVGVEILGITLQGGQSGPIDLLGAPTGLIPITDLVGTTQLLTADLGLPADTYGQLRMVVGDAYLVSTDGTVYVKGNPDPVWEGGAAPSGELQCPSCAQSGLKVTIPGDELSMDGEVALILDFDVSQSFGHKAGKSGKWVMHPVIHGVLADEPTGTQAIVGSVVLADDGSGNPITLPECPTETVWGVDDLTPTATTVDLLDGEGNPIVRTGTVMEDGLFQIGYLAPGKYTLGYENPTAPEGWTYSFVATVTVAGEPVLDNQVTVGNADLTDVLYTIESATCEAVSPSS
jgi:hypothetical protein